MQKLAEEVRLKADASGIHTGGNAVAWFVDRHEAEGRGAVTAFADPHRSLTYSELRRRTAQFAAAILRAGVHREQRVALVMLDTIDFPVAFWGAIRAGVVPVPINTLLTPDQTGYILADSRAAALVVSAPLLEHLRPVIDRLGLTRVIVAEVDGTKAAHGDFHEFVASGDERTPVVPASDDEVAFWLYSSGSTGMPKGVKHLHSSLRATADTYASQVLGIRADDLMFSAAKLFFAYGLGNGMTFPMSVGAGAVLLPDRPTPDAVVGVMRRFNPTLFGGVPTLYAGLLSYPSLGRGAGSSRLRMCISAGEPLPQHVGEKWREAVGVDILDGIGSTEMLHIFLSNSPDDIRYGTTGRAVPGYELRIADATGAEVPDGEEGELLVRGPSSAEGYWNQRHKSRTTFRGEWTHTGDTYVREPDGTYRYRGRADDMMKVGGIWVSPFEVEAALSSHPAIQEAAVVGHADADGLVKPKAYVVLRNPDDGHAPEALFESLKVHVKDRIGPWKYPRWIEVAESLPKTATGKIQRYKLRESHA